MERDISLGILVHSHHHLKCRKVLVLTEGKWLQLLTLILNEMISKDYFLPILIFHSWDIHKEATELGLYIKNKDGNDFDGWCWPGQSSYLDFTNPMVRKWWAEKFALDKYVGSTLDLFTWNDMNVIYSCVIPSSQSLGTFCI